MNMRCLRVSSIRDHLTLLACTRGNRIVTIGPAEREHSAKREYERLCGELSVTLSIRHDTQVLFEQLHHFTGLRKINRSNFERTVPLPSWCSFVHSNAAMMWRFLTKYHLICLSSSNGWWIAKGIWPARVGTTANDRKLRTQLQLTRGFELQKVPISQRHSATIQGPIPLESGKIDTDSWSPRVPWEAKKWGVHSNVQDSCRLDKPFEHVTRCRTCSLEHDVP
ncbi:hypothetical protein IW262DRAFT_223368 [Armillaria fumosa]|nr:hypothetical protein IW262DRAFT_223368 [Armillaria fumosa]